MTVANERECKEVTPHPEERPYKCYHWLDDNLIKTIAEHIDLWRAGEAEAKEVMAKEHH
jgi:hypothetical protein